MSIDETTVVRWIMRAVDRSEKIETNIKEIYVSEIASPCLRQRYYKRVKPLIPSPMDFIRLSGKSAHEDILSVVSEDGYHTEVSFSEKIRFRIFGEDHEIEIVGRVDAVKEDHILEFKFPEEIPSTPSHWNVMQVQLYMWIFKIPKSYIIYISRKNGRVRVFRVYRNMRIVRHALKRAIRFYAHLYRNIPPKPERGGWCSDCQYYMFCRGKEENKSK